MTNVRQTAVLRVDRFQGDNIIFNGGSRTENKSGRIVRNQSRLLSELDSMNIVGGWVTADTQKQGSWAIETPTNTSSNVQFSLTASFAGESKIVVPAGEFDTLAFHFKGYRNITGSISRFSTQYEATAWFSTKLNRVVKFSVTVPGSASRVDEEVVLQAIR
jgi:serine protease Do